jgi:hypothetical protein
MNQTIVALLTLVALCGASALAADAPPRGPVKTLDIVEADSGKTLPAVVGQAIDVRLEGSDPRCGWEASPVDGAVVRRNGRPGDKNVPAEVDFTPAPNAPNAEAGTYVFHYVADKPGRAELRFAYLSPSGPVPTARSATKLIKQMAVTIEVADVLPAGKPAQPPAPPPAQSPATGELQQLRVETLQQASQLVHQMYDKGTATNDQVLRTDRQLLDAQLERASSDEDRIKILEKALELAKKQEASASQQEKLGVATPLAALEAKADRLRVEIQLTSMRGN